MLHKSLALIQYFNMSEQEKQESQKTVVSFVAGLLIGGLLVWVFGGSPESTPTEKDAANDYESGEVSEDEDGDPESEASAETEDEASTPAAPEVAELPTGNAAVSVNDQPAGSTVSLEGATFPADEGWIGVRDYVDGQLTGLLGVARYSKEQGLVPDEIILQRATAAGKTYAVVFYSESGDRKFNLAEDVQVGGVMETFTAK